MNIRMPDGAWPTMLTPFTKTNEIDYPGLERMIEWYIARGVHGLFAVCQSSEMFYLSLEEREHLARFVVEKAAGRVPVIASGNVSDAIVDQVEEIRRISNTGIDAFVLISNRLAAPTESEDVWKANARTILEQVPDVVFGVYECPYPYKRLLSPELLKWCADTGRFYFLKDTCCRIDQMADKLAAVKGTQLKLFNANSTTLLASLRLGAAGFSGIMANFHPELYVWLTENWSMEPEQAQRVQSFLGPASLVELQCYPVNAKYYLRLEGLGIELESRVKPAGDFTATQRMEIEQLRTLCESTKSALLGETFVR